MTDSLAFRALDAHVLAGRADEPALVDASGQLSYAQLLHESASIAGALAQLGLGDGDAITIAIDQHREHVVSVLAAVRLGLVPTDDAPHRLVGDPPSFSSPGQDPVGWPVLVHAGRVDPAPARQHDTPEYEQQLLEAYADLLPVLLDGGTLH